MKQFYKNGLIIPKQGKALVRISLMVLFETIKQIIQIKDVKDGIEEYNEREWKR